MIQQAYQNFTEKINSSFIATKYREYLRKRALLHWQKRGSRSFRRKDFLVTIAQAEQLQMIKKIHGLSYSAIARSCIMKFLRTNSLHSDISNFNPYKNIKRTKERLSEMRVSVTLNPKDMCTLDKLVKQYKVTYSGVIRFALGNRLQTPLDNSLNIEQLKKGK